MLPLSNPQLAHVELENCSNIGILCVPPTAMPRSLVNVLFVVFSSFVPLTEVTVTFTLYEPGWRYTFSSKENFAVSNLAMLASNDSVTVTPLTSYLASKEVMSLAPVFCTEKSMSIFPEGKMSCMSMLSTLASLFSIVTISKSSKYHPFILPVLPW